MHVEAEEVITLCSKSADLGKYLIIIGCTEGQKYNEYPDAEAKIAKPVDDEGLLPCIGGRLLVKVIADQEVRTEPNALPAEIELEKVVRHHQHQHAEGEET